MTQGEAALGGGATAGTGSVADRVPPYEVRAEAMEARDPAFAKQVSRTKHGVLLLLVATVLGLFPLLPLQLFGGIVYLAGLVFLVVGRDAFGRRHSRLVVVGLAVVVVSAVVMGLTDAVVSAALFGGQSSLAGTAEGLRAMLVISLWTSLVGAVVGAAASILFVLELTTGRARDLLWLGLVATFVAAVVGGAIFATAGFGERVEAAADEALAGDGVDAAPVESLLERVGWFVAVLTLVPSLLFAAVYYLTWRRIDRGDLPRRTRRDARAAGT